MNETSLLSKCMLCPRACGVNRLAGEVGFCGMDHRLFLARAALHFWEEPCISGENGSGTVFFSGCNLRCVYCQNRQISRGITGKELNPDRLHEVFLSLQKQGAHNINLVTPTHYLCYLPSAVQKARENGLSIPIVYNTSGYESIESLMLLEGTVDIYLTDYKYFDSEISGKYSMACDYPKIANRAIREMIRQIGSPKYDACGMMQKGVIVRHLLLPGRGNDAVEIIRDLFALYGNRIVFSIMNQYTPPSDCDLPEPLQSTVDEREYQSVIDAVCKCGITNAYVQEGDTVGESFIPSFDLTGLEKW